MINQLLRRLKIRQRLWLLLILSLVGFTFLTITAITHTGIQFLSLQKNNTQTQVEGAKKIVDYFYQRSLNGELSRLEAKTQALAAIEAIRPDQRTYFYIYHASNFIVMHPFLKAQTFSDEPPEIVLESRDKFIEQLDQHATEHQLSQRILTPVEFFDEEHQGEQSGFFEYQYYVDKNNIGATAKKYDRTVPENAELKMAYGSKFEPWQWIIFGSVFLGDLDDIYKDMVIELFIPALIAISITIILIMLISRSITYPLKDTIRTIKRLTSGDNAKEKIDDRNSDEIDTLSRAFDALFVQTQTQSDLLQEKNISLENHRSNLETKIKLRTHNLAVATEQAQAANNAKSEFLASMSHELRTPLNGILGVLALLEDTEMSLQVRKSLDIVHSSGQQLLSTVNDILDFEKLSNGPVQLELIPFSPRSLFQQVCTIFEYELASKGIDLEIQCDNSVPAYFEGDPHRLKQIFNNLISNSVKFTLEGKIRIHISWEEEQELLSIDVIDTGVGIAKDRIDSIFQSFVQADSSTTRQYGGTGLGLGISKMLISLMNGSIQVQSKLNEGSTFTVKLPLNKTTTVPDIDSTHLSKASYFDASEIKVLVAEDNVVNQIVIKGFLNNFNISSDIVENGKTAQQAVLNDPDKYDLILMDISMPIMDGYEATEIIRKTLGNSNKPQIYALSANVLHDHIDKAEKSGMNGTLMKPIEALKLRDVLKKTLPAEEQ